MQKITILLLGLLLTVSITSCTSNTYANELKAEKTLIADYIQREGIEVLSAMPADTVFAANQYYLSTSGLYFQLYQKGSGTDTVEYRDEIIIRYKKYDLSIEPDTISYWTTAEIAYPPTFKYGISSTSACSAWHEAVSYMKRSGACARLIVPAEIGFSDDQSPLTPYCYDIKILIRK